MTRRRPALAAAVLLPVLLPVLGGCAIVPDIAAIATGGGVAAATGSPALGFAAGLGVRAAVDALLSYVDRARRADEQDIIAEAAGSAPLGEERPWAIRRTIPIGNASGTLLAVREFGAPLTTCREVVFTVVDGADRRLLTTTLCHRGDRWAWAAAEPAVDRWGSMQGGR